MAKQTHQDTQNSSSRNALIAMSIGALLVAGLVGWALTRTVEAPVTTPAPASTAQFPTTTVATNPETMPAVDSTNPMTSSPITAQPGTSQPINAPAQNAPIGDKTTVARLSAEDLRGRVSAGSVTIVDVRDANSFAAGHIPGAVHIPYAAVEANLDSLPKGKEIVFYCT